MGFINHLITGGPHIVLTSHVHTCSYIFQISYPFISYEKSSHPRPGVHLCRRLGRKFVFTGTVWGLGGVDDSMAQTIKIASDVENIGKHL